MNDDCDLCALEDAVSDGSKSLSEALTDAYKLGKQEGWTAGCHWGVNHMMTENASERSP